MTFQSTVNRLQTPFLQGAITRENPINILPYFSEDAFCQAGGFVFSGTDAETQVKGKSAGALVAEGIATRTPYQTNLTGGDSNFYNIGKELTILSIGYIAVKPTTQAVKGQDVVVDPATGEIQTVVLASETTVAGTVTGTTDTTAGTTDTALDDGTLVGGIATTAYTNMPAGFIFTGVKVSTGASADTLSEIFEL